MFAALTYQALMLYASIGILAGVLAGMLGIGGGLIIVPALLFLFEAQRFPQEVVMHLAVASSLATIMFTSASSALFHHRRGAVLWSRVAALAPGILCGALAGGIIADRLPGSLLRVVFGVFECAIALQIGWGRDPAPHRELPRLPGLLGVGAAIGALSSILGIGGGLLTVPFLLWCNINIRNAVGTSSACGFPIAVAGTAALIASGWDHPALPTGATGYVYWPAALLIAAASVLGAPVGARLAHALPTHILRRIFAIFLVVVGIRMLVQL